VPLTEEKPRGAQPVTVKVTRVLLHASLAAAVVAWGLIGVVDVESVLFTGPLLFSLGLILAVLGANSRRAAVGFLGVSLSGVCILFPGLVNGLNWSPGEAHAPFLILGLGYLVLAAVLYRRALSALGIERSPWFCKGCGYLLRGLAEPRCPECGTAFDPAELEGHELPDQIGDASSTG
jgi:hypothetical protein